MRTPFIICEAAGTHDGDLEKMLRSIAAAKEADGDAWKTWWCSSAKRVAERMSAPDMLDTYRIGQWPTGWMPVLRNACKANGLELLITVDCPEDIGVVAPFVDRFKVASWGCDDEEFIGAHLKHDKPLIISTGGVDEETLADIATEYMTDERVHLLHCVSGYPAPLADMELSVIRDFNLDGFSDHTKKVMMGALAVAAGARVIEVHFCLPDTAPDNPDRCVSHEPLHLAEYVRLARLAAVAMGDGRKRVMPSEEKFLRHRYCIP